MVKVIFPTPDSSKSEIQSFLKRYKIKYSFFQTTEELFILINENKKLIFDTEKEYKKALKNSESSLPVSNSSVEVSSSSTSSSSSYSSSYSSTTKSTASSTKSSYGSKSLESPFKKKLELKKQSTTTSAIETMNIDKVINHKKPLKKLNLCNNIVNNTIYVFVSSTFKDMCGERDHLIKNIFPALNVKAKSKNIQIVPIDLRWGLTKEETTVKGQIELCLKQIDKCQIMVTMLGNRFGWIPKEYKFLDDAQEDSTSKWLQTIPLGESITSIEVQYALSKSNEKHSIALLRDPEFQSKVPLLHQGSFNSESDEAANGVKSLKNLLIQHPSCPVIENYPCRFSGIDKDANPFTGSLDLFGKEVFDHIWNIIELEFPNPIQELESMEQENINHRNYYLTKSSDYFAREAIQKKLNDHIFGSNSIDKIGIIYGEPGSGKSSSLAYLIKTLQSNKDVFVLYHFVGCSINSTDVTNVLFRFVTQLVDHLGLKNIEITENHEKLRILFNDLLKKGAKSKKILLIIDGLDELQNTNQAYQMEWLAESQEIGKNIFVLLSCDHGKQCWDYIHLRSQIPQTFYLTPLEMVERQIIATKTLEVYSKKLEQKLMDRLISKTHSKFPLFIKLACEELRISGSFDKLSNFIVKIPDTIDALILSMIARLEQDLGKELIKKTLCFIACSRFGLLESELIELLKEKNAKQPLAFSVWAPLLHSINSLLRHTTGNSSVLTFFHGEINKVIIKKYLPIEKSQITVQNQLADYYWKQSDPEGSKTWSGTHLKSFIELPYHLLKAKRWDLISQILQDLSFIEVKFKIGLGRDLIENYLACIAEILAPSLTGERWAGYNFSSVVNVEDFYAFIQYQQHHLYKFPHITSQQAFNLPDDSICHRVSEKVLESKKSPLIKWINKLQVSDFVIQTLSGHEDFVRCTLYKDDGSLIASCSDDKTIRIWNGETGQLARVFGKGGHCDKITNLQWRGNTLVTVSRDKKVVLWDDLGKVLHEFRGHTQAVWGVSVSPDQKRIVSASWDQTAIVWDVGSGQLVQTLKGHKNKLSACAFSRNGKYIATGCWSGIVIIWDAKDFSQVASITVCLNSTVLFLQFSNDDKFLSVSSVDTFTHIVKVSNWTKIQSLEGHTEAVISSRFSSDSKFLVSCSDDKTVRIYDTNDWNQVQVMTGHSGRIISAAFHPSNTKRRVITCATDKFIKIWDPKLGYTTTNQAHQGHKKSVKFLHYDKPTDRLFSVSDDKTIKIWKDFSQSDLLNPSQTISLGVERLSFINSSTIVTISEGKTKMIKLTSEATHEISDLSPAFAHSSNVPSFAISPKDPNLMAYINKGALVLSNDLNDISKELERFVLAFGLVHCSFHSSGDFIACTNNTGFVVFKQSSSGKWSLLTSVVVNDPNSTNTTPHAFVTNTQHNKADGVAVSGMCWGQNYFAVGSTDGTVSVYDIKRSFYFVTKFKGHDFALHGMSFSPNDKYLFTGSIDKQSILWDCENNFKNVSVFPLASISTSNVLFYKDAQDHLTIVLSDYTGKIHNLKLLNVAE